MKIRMLACFDCIIRYPNVSLIRSNLCDMGSLGPYSIGGVSTFICTIILLVYRRGKCTAKILTRNGPPYSSSKAYYVLCIKSRQIPERWISTMARFFKCLIALRNIVKQIWPTSKDNSVPCSRCNIILSVPWWVSENNCNRFAVPWCRRRRSPERTVATLSTFLFLIWLKVDEATIAPGSKKSRIFITWAFLLLGLSIRPSCRDVDGRAWSLHTATDSPVRNRW